MSQVELSKEQIAENRAAIHGYINRQTRINGGLSKSPVILVPEFEYDEDNGWVPVQSNGVRLTKKDGFGFTRLGMAFLKDNMEAGYLLMNNFNNEQKLIETIDLMGITVGDAIPGKVLVVEESLNPFSLKNPERDLKFAGNTGIVCSAPDENGEVCSIYRRVKLAPVGTPNVLIAHTNSAEIQAFNSAAWEKMNAPVQTPAIKNAGAKLTGKK